MPSSPSSCPPPLPHALLPFLMPSSPSSCPPPLPHALLPFLMPSSPSSCPPFPLLSFPFTPLSLHFPVYHTSSLPPIPPYHPLFIPLSLTHFHFFPLSYGHHSIIYYK